MIKWLLLMLAVTMVVNAKPSFEEINNTFDEISKKYDIPASVLKALSYEQTNWDVFFTSDKNRFGIMGLNANKSIDSIEFGAKLTKFDEFDGIANYKKNIEMSAAILKKLTEAKTREGYLIETIEDYFPVIITYLDFSPELYFYAEDFAYKLYQNIHNGYRIIQNDDLIDIKPTFIDFSKIVLNSLNNENIIIPPVVTDGPSSLNIRWVSAHSNNYTVASRTASTIDMIVIHQAAGSYSACVNWFASANNTYHTSAHYCISKYGEITQMVKIKDKAHHAGTRNMRSIGIEHEGTATANLFTDAEYRASALLVKWLSTTYGVVTTNNHLSETQPGIVRHHENCPGPYWNWTYYKQLINNTTSTGTVAFITPTNNSTVRNPVIFTSRVTGDVKKVKYYAENDYYLGESTSATTNFKLSFTFSGVNTPRVITAKGFNSAGTLITNAKATITFTPVNAKTNNISICENECNVDDLIMCVNEYSLKICGDFDEDNCLEWSEETQAKNNECLTESCNNECSENEVCINSKCINFSNNDNSQLNNSNNVDGCSYSNNNFNYSSLFFIITILSFLITKRKFI